MYATLAGTIGYALLRLVERDFSIDRAAQIKVFLGIGSLFARIIYSE